MRWGYGECFEKERDWGMLAYDTKWWMVIREARCCRRHARRRSRGRGRCRHCRGRLLLLRPSTMTDVRQTRLFLSLALGMIDFPRAAIISLFLKKYRLASSKNVPQRVKATTFFSPIAATRPRPRSFGLCLSFSSVSPITSIPADIASVQQRCS